MSATAFSDAPGTRALGEPLRTRGAAAWDIVDTALRDVEFAPDIETARRIARRTRRKIEELLRNTGGSQ